MNTIESPSKKSLHERMGEVFVSGSVSALTAFPLSIGFALLAGVPPVIMILASIYSAIFNATLAGRYGVGGPNTAVAMLTGAALMPFAPAETSLYMGYVFALCVLVGCYQLLFALMLRKVDLMDYVSTTVIDGITFGIGGVFVLTSLWMAAGLAQPGGTQWTVFNALMSVDRTLEGSGSSYALLISGVTMLSGVICWQFKKLKRFGILIGLAVGFLCAQWLGKQAPLEYVGRMSMSLFATSLPDFRQVSWPVIFSLAGGPALAIALVGMLQTLSIAKAIRDPDEQYRPDREMLSQGLQHVFMGFFSGAPVSNSFNKSALKRDLGGGRSSQLFSAVVTAAMIYLVGGIVADIPMSALGGALILVGLGMLNLKKYKHHLNSGVLDRILFFLPALMVVAMDIQTALLIGFGLSLLAHFWKASKPNVLIAEHLARDGRHVSVITIDGNLFFGSQRYVGQVLAGAGDPGERNILLLRTDHLTYIDIPGAGLLAEEAIKRRRQGDELYIYATRKQVIDVLQKAGALTSIGEGNIIYRDRDHPMKSLLNPFGIKEAKNRHAASSRQPVAPQVNSLSTADLVERLRSNALFSHIHPAQLEKILLDSHEQAAGPDFEVTIEGSGFSNVLILLAGEVEVSRIWTSRDGVERTYAWQVGSHENGSDLSVIHAFGGHVRAKTLTDVRYMTLRGSDIDEFLGWSQLDRNMTLAKHLKVFSNIPLEHIKMAFDRMVEREVEAGETVIRQGEPGDSFYIILSGQAEVSKTDPFSGDVSSIVMLGDGDAFGEDALLQNTRRNATVKMNTPGRLLVLSKVDFDQLLKPVMVHEISPQVAQAMLDSDSAKLIDCRYDIEFEQSHIPGAMLVPLDQLRDDVSMIMPNATYIIYCSSGKRSKVATFLLNERGIKAMSLIGGLKSWPYDIESSR